MADFRSAPEESSGTTPAQQKRLVNRQRDSYLFARISTINPMGKTPLRNFLSASSASSASSAYPPSHPQKGSKMVPAEDVE